jgi:hypothetical protein
MTSTVGGFAQVFDEFLMAGRKSDDQNVVVA